MENKIIMGGFGGQGIVLAGNILARAALLEGKNIAGMVSYGAEVRGGTANSSVIISDEEIFSPVISKANTLFAFNQPSLNKFSKMLSGSGLVVVNTSLIKDLDAVKEGVKIIKIPATDIAIELGNVRAANIVAIGAYIKASGFLKKESVLEIIEGTFSKKSQELVELNKKAFEKGYNEN
ncbi:2-oxoacid:acceptor oxidoreductase family protein [Candidatus Woesearchaeota archaeon]|nr:2-oxoacid:acceptor oxidoreductase family protein [Candidatus Woesearchaeota archaeon]